MDGLVADIGGTNARFAGVAFADGRPQFSRPVAFKCADHPNVEAAIDAYLVETDAPVPRFAALAVAGPVYDNAIQFTNNPWAFSGEGIARAFGFEAARLVNDYAANAHAIPYFSRNDLASLGGPDAVQGAEPFTAAVLGPGTGFGASALVHAERLSVALASEAGHAALAPANADERALLGILSREHDRVSIEDVLSGPGLLRLYRALAEHSGAAPARLTPEEVTRCALAGTDFICVQALEQFCAWLGAVAGDIALIYGARGGVYIAGGIAPDILPFLRASEFRTRFDDKARFADYMKTIPTSVVTRPSPALLGAAAILHTMMETR